MSRRAGFTLIEIVFVIGILGVLATFGFRNFDFVGKGLAEQLAARDAVTAELRRARSQALHRLSPPPPLSDSATVTADLKGAVSEQWTVDPVEVEFSYEGNGSIAGPQSHVEITITEAGDTLWVCLPSTNGRISEGPCQ